MRTYYKSAGYLAADTIAAQGGTLALITGFNPTANAGFLLLFESETVPVNGDAPIEAISVPANANFSLSPVPPGRPFAHLHFAVSSTGDTLTASADAYSVSATVDAG